MKTPAGQRPRRSFLYSTVGVIARSEVCLPRRLTPRKAAGRGDEAICPNERGDCFTHKDGVRYDGATVIARSVVCDEAISFTTQEIAPGQNPALAMTLSTQ